VKNKSIRSSFLQSFRLNVFSAPMSLLRWWPYRAQWRI